EPFQSKLNVSLEELFTGTTKRLRVNRKMQNGSTSEQVIEINVKPGWKAGTAIKYRGAGDQLPDGSFQDVEFVIAEKPHPVFKRDGHNLQATLEVTLAEAMCGFSKTIKGIDGKTLTVSGAQGPTPQQPGSMIFLAKQGMVKSKEPHQRGDLFVEIKVKLPGTVTSIQKDWIRSNFGR
ncbi:HSP40/DnaJ peptide-binding protein, partial [Caulochytrium protostelioides]